jgi:hypothetical protein
MVRGAYNRDGGLQCSRIIRCCRFLDYSSCIQYHNFAGDWQHSKWSEPATLAISVCSQTIKSTSDSTPMLPWAWSNDTPTQISALSASACHGLCTGRWQSATNSHSVAATLFAKTSMESVHTQRQMANVRKLIQACTAIVTNNDLSDAAVVAAKAQPCLRRQLQGSAREITDDVLVANHDDVLF